MLVLITKPQNKPVLENKIILKNKINLNNFWLPFKSVFSCYLLFSLFKNS